MNMTTRSITMALIVTAAVFAGSACLAEDISARGPVPFASYDTDGNGSISEQEFNAVREERQTERTAEGRLSLGAADAPTFSQIDTNGDGQISPEELTAAHQAQWEKKGMDRGKGR